MFTDYFYLMRRRGLDIAPNEWMSLLEALEKGLHGSSLTGFYHVARAILVKNETEYDRFDQIFLEYFQGVPFQGEIPDELMDWLNHPSENLFRELEELKKLGVLEESLEELLKRLEERLAEQTEEHNGGNYWVGTQGRSAFGNNGWHPGGIRVGGESRHRSAVAVASQRQFRDFRKDNKLDTRQFQMAFRLLRNLSAQSNEEEFDVDATIHDTCENAGTLQVRYKKARRNTIKVLMLMDSGGSMDYYAGLCSQLFQAATSSRHFKELHTYYFHNCIGSNIYKDPRMNFDSAVQFEKFLAQYDKSYRVILVGDAAMNPYELDHPQYDFRTHSYGLSGIECFRQMKRQFPHLIWLNPESLPAYDNYWTRTHLQLAELFDMYDLSVDGLEQGMKQLLSRRAN
ncbi:MAG: VWA domain-containing protein [Eubacterium sp.]|nr:VWA domain-containing protein [Eubacterium sp.]